MSHFDLSFPLIGPHWRAWFCAAIFFLVPKVQAQAAEQSAKPGFKIDFDPPAGFRGPARDELDARKLEFRKGFGADQSVLVVMQIARGGPADVQYEAQWCLEERLPTEVAAKNAKPVVIKNGAIVGKGVTVMMSDMNARIEALYACIPQSYGAVFAIFAEPKLRGEPSEMRSVIRALARIKFTDLSPPVPLNSAGIPYKVQAATGALCTPAFSTRFGNFGAGTAFLLRKPQQLVSALHLFGAAGGLSESIAGKDLANTVTGATCQMWFGDDLHNFDRPWSLPKARPFDEKRTAADVVFFPSLGNRDLKEGLVFATEPPRVGEKVWLLGRPLSGGEPNKSRDSDTANKSRDSDTVNKYAYAARVIDVEKGWLAMSYENTNIVLSGTSGGPIVNAQGEVVAINAAGFPSEHRLIGLGTSTAAALAVFAGRTKATE